MKMRPLFRRIWDGVVESLLLRDIRDLPVELTQSKFIPLQLSGRALLWCHAHPLACVLRWVRAMLSSIAQRFIRVNRQLQKISFNSWVDRTHLNSIFTYGILAISAVGGVIWTYQQNDSYWMLIFGERGPAAESALMLITASVAFWIRQISFSHQSQTIDYPTRHQLAFRGFFVFSLGLLLLYLLVVGHFSYRYPTPWLYFILWCVPLAFYVSWSFEVIWAVVGAYWPPKLWQRLLLSSRSSNETYQTESAFTPETDSAIENLPHEQQKSDDGKKYVDEHSIVDDSQWEALADRVAQDTQELVWPLGTLSFFFLGYFAEFYLAGSTGLTLVVIAFVVLISVIPWLFVRIVAYEYFDREMGLIAQLIDKAQSERIQHPYGTAPWKSCMAQIKEHYEELNRLQMLRDRFNVMAWLNARVKDIVPLAAIKILGPTWFLPIIDQLLNVFNLNR